MRKCIYKSLDLGMRKYRCKYIIGSGMKIKHVRMLQNRIQIDYPKFQMTHLNKTNSLWGEITGMNKKFRVCTNKGKDCIPSSTTHLSFSPSNFNSKISLYTSVTSNHHKYNSSMKIQPLHYLQNNLVVLY